MAGVNFMALAEGMMLGDELNKKDETYWRKQAAEDRAMQYQERDQAYKEQEQGYKLNTFEDYQQNKDAARYAAQAFDGYVQAAKAQGIPLAQVIMNSQPYNLPNATPQMMARFNEKLNNAIDVNVVAPLRLSRDFDTADKLQKSLGLQPNAPENSMLAFGNPEKAHEFINSRIPGVARDANNNYLISGVPFTAAEAMNIVTSTPAAAAAAVAAREREVRTGTRMETMQLDSGKRQSEIDGRRAALQAIQDGYGRTSLPEAYRGYYDEMVAERRSGISGSGSPPIGASIDAATAAPASAPVAPAAIKSVAPITTGVSPTGGITSRVAAPASTQPPVDQWRDVLLQANKAQAEVDALEAQRSALKKDLSTMDSLAGRKHFDPATIANARRQLVELNSLLSLKSTELDSIHAQVRQAPVARPGYVNILNDKYKVK